MKVALINDTHCGCRNSSDIFLDNAEKFFTDVFFPYLLEHNISHIVHLGDYFDNRKFINFRALSRNRSFFLKKLREYGITMDIIRGNHDTYFKNTGELNSLKELLGHYMNEVNIIHEPTVMEYGSLKMGLVPWIDAENEKQSLDFLSNAKCDIIGGHFDIIGYEMLRGIKCEHGIDRSVFNRFESVYSGHFHTKSTQDNITYLGSQLELNWNDADDKKYFHVLDTETRSLDAIHNPHTLFKRIRYDDTNTDYLHYDLSDIDGRFVKVQVINKSDQYTFDRFIDRVQSRSILELKIAENFNEFMGENVEDQEISVEDTSTLLYTYIDAVDTDLSKDKIKAQMTNLMTEAQTLEIA
jgi:DNA repair exonuclease SbcCD nuclease subunit